MRVLIDSLFSARQLLWLLLIVACTGFALLVPLFIQGDAPEGAILRALRTAHSAATALLFIGACAHGVTRIATSSHGMRGAATGILATTAIAAGAVSGAFLGDPRSFSGVLGADPSTIRHASAIFHYGYAAVLAGALTFWHSRSTSRIRADRATAALTAVVLLVAVGWPAPTQGTFLLTRILVPATAGAWAWTLMGPNLLWLQILRRRQPMPASDSDPSGPV